MLCFFYKRLIAQILLFGELLTSCDKVAYLQLGPPGVVNSWTGVDTRVDLSSGSTPVLQSPNCRYTFLKPPGYAVVLDPYLDGWKAMVHDKRFPGLSRSYSAAVQFEKGYRLEDLVATSPVYQSGYIHLLSIDKDRPVVYIGRTGLKGGGLFNWFGCTRCTWFGCFDEVWRCVCGYRCSDN